ncbi:hypothetical protein ACWY4P_43035 [Streptomyces sp. LZ34]
MTIVGAAVLASGGYYAQAHQGDDTRPAARASKAEQEQLNEFRPTRTPRAGLTEGLSLPLEQYLVAYPDEVSFAKAKYQLDSACMAGFKLSLDDPKPGDSPPLANTSANMPRRYGVTDLAEAQKYGYHLAQDVAEARAATDDSAASEGQWSDAQELVYYGGPPPEGQSVRSLTYEGKPVPEGGCSSDSLRTLGGDLNEDLASELDGNSFDESQEDPRVKAAVQAWSECMSGKGHAVTDPDVAAHVESDDVTSEEIARASDDVACKESTGLVTIWFGVEKEIQTKLIADNHDALEAAKRKNTAVLRAVALVR